MPLFNVSLLDNTGTLDCIFDSNQETILVTEHSNYTTSDEIGNENADFNIFRKLIITSPNGNAYVYSSLPGGSVTILPGDSGVNLFPTYVVPSEGDGVYTVNLRTVPTWRELVTWNFSTPMFGAALSTITVDGTPIEVFINPDDDYQTLVDYLNSGSLGNIGVFSYPGSGTVISVVGNHQYGSFKTYNGSNVLITNYPATQVYNYSNTAEVYYSGNFYKSLQNNNSCNQPGVSPLWWQPITEDTLSSKYSAFGYLTRTIDLIDCKIKAGAAAACSIRTCSDICDNPNWDKWAKLAAIIDAINAKAAFGEWEEVAELIGIGKQICGC